MTTLVDRLRSRHACAFVRHVVPLAPDPLHPIAITLQTSEIGRGFEAWVAAEVADADHIDSRRQPFEVGCLDNASDRSTRCLKAGDDLGPSKVDVIEWERLPTVHAAGICAAL